MSHFSRPFQKIYTVFLFGSLVSGWMILFPMPFLYVHLYYSIIYITLFIFGGFVGNICQTLFQWKPSSLFLPTWLLQITVLTSIFLFPYAHRFYPIFLSIQWLLLGISFLMGFSLFLVIQAFKRFIVEPFYFPALLFSAFLIVISLIFQIYSSSPVWEVYEYMALCIFCCFCSSRSRWALFFSILLLVLALIAVILFQRCGLFYISTDSGSPQTRIFEMGEQVDVYKPKEATKKDLDIADGYTGGIDTTKKIYLNGRYYGKLVENENRKDYAAQTPLSVLFALQDNPRVLILNSSGGGDVSLTHLLINGEIDALEDNQNVLDQIRDQESLYVGGVYHNRNTLFYHSSVRSYTATTNKKYDTVLLRYTVSNPYELFFLQERESQFSTEAIRDYLRVLNPQGILFLSIQTFSPELTQTLLLSLVSTLESVLKLDTNQWDNSLYLFQTPYSLNLLFAKVPFTSDKQALYKQKISALGYQDIFSDANNSLGRYAKALLYKDKNQISTLSFSSAPIQDDGNNWVFSMFRNIPLPYKSMDTFNPDFVQKVLVGFFLFCLALFFLYRRQFKRQQLYNMGLGLFFPYCWITGIVLGLDLSFGIVLSNVLQADSFVFGKVFLAAFLCSQMVGLFLSSLSSWRLYEKIQLGLGIQFIVHGVLFIGFSAILNFFIIFPLGLRILLPSLAAFVLYVFSFALPSLQQNLAAHMQTGDHDKTLWIPVFMGVLTGFCAGFLMIFYFSMSASLGVGCFLLLILMFYTYSLHKRLKMIDYIYSEKKI